MDKMCSVQVNDEPGSDQQSPYVVTSGSIQGHGLDHRINMVTYFPVFDVIYFEGFFVYYQSHLYYVYKF